MKSQHYKRLGGRLIGISWLLASLWIPAQEAIPNLRTYSVDRKVSDFPSNEDLTTPEAAYATLTRAWIAEGEAAFERLSVSELAAGFPPASKKPMEAKSAAMWLGAEVLEVSLHAGTNAVVLARIKPGGREQIDVRWLLRENGRWLNHGNDVVGTIQQGRQRFARACAFTEAKAKLASRPAIANPEEYLRPFVGFLRREAAEPKTFLLEAVADHQLVLLGEVHHRPRYWTLNAELVRAPAFAERVGAIYLELPSNDQGLVEQFLAAGKYDPHPVIDLLRDMLWTGWPDQPMLDFFKAIWETNQKLNQEQRLRIVCVDMERPWKQIKRRADWRKYEQVGRDQMMAENVVRDLREHAADRRHALFIVGYAHAMLNLNYPNAEPIRSAGWYLRQKLGGNNVFAVFPHSPVMANMGGVSGRIALGLFETAFAAVNNRPMAFPLERGPFGEQIFDASIDHITTDPFRQGYQAYLYLGPLEDERFSPLIPGFYTDEFVKEVDRRFRLMNGKGWAEAYSSKGCDAESFSKWMSQNWGQPRYEWSARQLGPLRAWERGSDWEKNAVAAKLKDWTENKAAIRQEAGRLFEAIRKAGYDAVSNWEAFPAPDVHYQVYTDYPAWTQWVCGHFRTNPIVAVQLAEVTAHTNGLPAVPYVLALKDGSKLQGLLPMNYDARGESWYGCEGLDWHRWAPVK